MTDEPVGTVTHDLVVAMHLELEIEMPANRDERPERERDPACREADADGRRRLGELQLGAETECHDGVRDPAEKWRPLRDAGGDLGPRAAARASSAEHDLRGHGVREKRRDDDGRDEHPRGDVAHRLNEHHQVADPRGELDRPAHPRASRSRSADSAFAPVSSWRKYAYTSFPASSIGRSRAAHASTSASE